MKTWQCFGCSYRCKCETEDSIYCIPKKCLIYELHASNWQPEEAEEKEEENAKEENAR